MTELALPYFVALPEHPTGRGVVVAHEGLGLTTQILRVAERLAGEGCAVVAPDLFFRTGGPRDEQWWDSINAITDDDLRDDLSVSIAALRALGATSIGVTGFCLGGRVAYRASKWADDLGVDAVVAFYGSAIPEAFGELRCPTMLLFAEHDEYIPSEEIDAVQERHGDAVHVYPGVGHAFMRDGSDSYDAATAAAAWERMLGFFGEHLQPA
jgi:carboxymethylenebutenolidase